MAGHRNKRGRRPDLANFVIAPTTPSDLQQCPRDTPDVIPEGSNEAEQEYNNDLDNVFDYRRPSRPFTYELRMKFLWALAQCGFLYLAAARVGVSPATVRTYRKQEKEFDDACTQAIELATESVLLREAQRRAVEGVDVPIIGGQFKDEVVAYERRYSDGLLKMLIQGRRPEFRDGPRGTDGKYPMGQGGVILIPSQQTVIAIPGKTAQQTAIDAWAENMGELARGEPAKELAPVPVETK
jgi:hypothetical protein